MSMEKDNRTLAELEKAYLSDESAAEFDRIVRNSRARWRRPMAGFALAAAAAAIALILTLSPKRDVCTFDGLEIAEGIQQILNLDTDDVRSVTATPEGSRVILTARMKDGSECSYVMSRAEGTDAVLITAMKQ